MEEDELKSLELLVSGYLEFAEGMAKRHIPMTMQDWAIQLDQILIANKHELLQNAGKISMDIANNMLKPSLKNIVLCKINCLKVILTGFCSWKIKLNS